MTESEQEGLDIQGRYRRLSGTVADCAREAGQQTRLVAVSKTRTADEIETLLGLGQRDFGENRVQEAREKWPALREKYPDARLRLIGALQTNKVKFLPGLFDAIDSVDRPALVDALVGLGHRQGYWPECLIQVNTGDEPQKAGVQPEELEALLDYGRNAGLNITGLMCIPPLEEAASIHFAFLRQRADALGLSECSMGMSSDYRTAIALGSTMVRVGTELFGARP